MAGALGDRVWAFGAGAPKTIARLVPQAARFGCVVDIKSAA